MAVGSRSFNGSTDKILVGNPSQVQVATWTISAWVFWTVNSVYQSIANYGHGTNGSTDFRNYDLALNNSNQARIYFTSGSATYHGIEGGTTLSANTWYHLSATYDGSTLLLYVNGVQEASPLSTSATPDSTGGNLNIGCLYTDTGGATNEPFGGNIADVALWNVALTVNELLSLAKGTRPWKIRKSSLKGVWPLFGLQSPEPDYSGNINSGALTGTGAANGPPINPATRKVPTIYLDQNTSTGVGSATFTLTPAGVSKADKVGSGAATVSFAAAAHGLSNYYVSTTGSDAADGSQATPWLTLDHARTTIQGFLSAMATDINVWIRGGTYRLSSTLAFTSSDNGQNGFTVNWKAYPGETPIISGGVVLGSWTLHDAILNIWQSTTSHTPRVMWVDGKRTSRARSFVAFSGSQNGSTGYTSSTYASYARPQDLEFVYRYRWVNQHLQVDTVSGSAVTMLQPGFGNAVAASLLPSVPNWWENAYELLGTPGYFYADGTTCYYVPRSTENMATSTIVCPILTALVTVTGADHISFSGITFRDTTWTLPSVGFSEIQANTYLPTSGFVTTPNRGWPKVPAAFQVLSASTNITFITNTILAVGTAGIAVEGGSSHCSIIGNEIHDTSGCGITISDTVEITPATVTDSIAVNNNYVHHVGREFEGAPAIICWYASNVVIRNNEIRHSNYSGISMGWGWGDTGTWYNCSATNAITNNHISFVAEILIDAGGIYCNGVQGASGATGSCTVTGNVVTDMIMTLGAALYIDDGGENYTIDSNGVFRINGGTTCYNVLRNDDYGNNHITNNYLFDGTLDNSVGVKSETHGADTISGNITGPTTPAIINAAGLESAYQYLLGTPAAPSTSPVTLAWDAFTDSTNANLTTHPMSFGSGWTAQAGTWKINASNQAILNSPDASNQNIATVNCGTPDHAVMCDITNPSLGDDSGLVCRFVDTSNYWLLVVSQASPPRLLLYEVNQGEFILRTVSPTLTSPTSLAYQVLLKCSGTSIVGYMGLSETDSKANLTGVSVAYDSDFLSTSTKCGIREYSGSASDSIFDNFRVFYSGAIYLFDFDVSTAPATSAGFASINEASVYSAGVPGWSAGTISSVDRADSSPLWRDLNFSPDGTFKLDIPSGSYDLTLHMGDPDFAHDTMGVIINGSQVDTVSTAAHEMKVLTYPGIVSTGSITIRLQDQGGGDPYAVISALVIAPTAQVPPSTGTVGFTYTTKAQALAGGVGSFTYATVAQALASGSGIFTFSPASTGLADKIAAGGSTFTISPSGVSRADKIASGSTSVTLSSLAAGLADATGNGAASFTLSPTGGLRVDASGGGSATVTFSLIAGSQADKVAGGSSAVSFVVTATSSGGSTGVGSANFIVNAAGGGSSDALTSGSSSASFTVAGHAGNVDTASGISFSFFTAAGGLIADAKSVGAGSLRFSPAGFSFGVAVPYDFTFAGRRRLVTRLAGRTRLRTQLTGRGPLI